MFVFFSKVAAVVSDDNGRLHRLYVLFTEPAAACEEVIAGPRKWLPRLQVFYQEFHGRILQVFAAVGCVLAVAGAISCSMVPWVKWYWWYGYVLIAFSLNFCL